MHVQAPVWCRREPSLRMWTSHGATPRPALFTAHHDTLAIGGACRPSPILSTCPATGDHVAIAHTSAPSLGADPGHLVRPAGFRGKASGHRRSQDRGARGATSSRFEPCAQRDVHIRRDDQGGHSTHLNPSTSCSGWQHKESSPASPHVPISFCNTTVLCPYKYLIYEKLELTENFPAESPGTPG